FHNAVLILEWPIGNLNRLANFERDFRFHLLLPLLHLREHRFDFRRSHRDWFILRSGKPDYPWRILDKIPGAIYQLIILIEQMHVDNEVAGKKLPCRLALFAFFDFRNPLGWNKYFVDDVVHFLGLDALLDILLDLVFLA